MENKNETLEITNNELEYGNLIDLRSSLQVELNDILDELSSIEDDREKLKNNQYLEEAIQDIIWDQVQNQLAVQIGEEFIKDNNGQKLDLRKEAHIQTAENFEKGKLATHNRDVNFQERYDTWQNNFAKDDLGNIQTHSTRSGKIVNTLTKEARKPFDTGRPTGSKEKGTQMDHTVSAGEIIRDPKANAFLTKEEQIAFANSKANLNEIRSEVNQAKGDLSTSELFDNPNSKGQYAREVHNISSKEEKQLREKDKEARTEYDRVRDEAEKRAIKSGKKSRRDEALKISGKALKAALLQLLSDGNLWRKSQLIKPLAEKLGLNEAEINAEYPSGNGNIFADKISWVLSYHALTGLLLRPKRGFYQITDLGKQYADKDDIEVINFVKEKMALRHNNKDDKTEIYNEIESDTDPRTQLEQSFHAIRQTVYDEILETVISKTPATFEKLVVDLLKNMGYGGKVEKSAIVTKQSRDGGIDGEIREDVLGLGRIFVS